MTEPTTEQVAEALRAAWRAEPYDQRDYTGAAAVQALYAPVLAENERLRKVARQFEQEAAGYKRLAEKAAEIAIELGAQVQRVEALIDSADHEAHGHDGEAFLSAVLTSQVRAALAGPADDGARS